MKKIIHLIHNDKFSSGYINFMISNMKDYEHKFFLEKGKYEVDLIDNNFLSSIQIIDFKEIFKKEINKEFLDADKIIVTGIFGVEKYLFFLPKSILNKIYLQFWGGDFYAYRNVKKISKTNLKKMMMHYCIKKCAGIINLINGEYEELSKIFPNNTKHYIGIMPADPRRIENFEVYLAENKKTKRIIIGNSATKENYHIEVFEMLEHLKDENIEIVSPISYGNMEYAKQVEKVGKKIFGEKFIPIKEFMRTEEYLKFLSTCSVGIFNNDRQQAMGNINRLLKLGKKVYLRKGTSMYNDYQKYGIKIFDVEELKGISYKELYEFDFNKGKDNYQKMLKRDEDYNNDWKKILDT